MTFGKTPRHLWSITALAAALALVGIGSATAAPSSEVAATVTAMNFDITVTGALSLDPSLDFGTLEFGECVKTGTTGMTLSGTCAGTESMRGTWTEVTNNGSTAKISVRYKPLQILPSNVFGADCDGVTSTAEWAPTTGAQGTNQFKMDAAYSLGSGTYSTPTVIPTGMSSSTVIASLASGANENMYWALYMPTSGSTGPCNWGIVITASAP